MNDWDLQAIVGGYGGRGEISASINTQVENISCSHSKISNKPADHKLVDRFTQLCEFAIGLDEHLQHDQPYRPSSPVLSPVPTQSVATNSVSLPHERTVVLGKSPGVLPDFVRINKPKKGKKNQNKSVVKHVTAESPRSDVWAWRKYGQKPIKGSPHPRSYYRCSSSKGCSARKQVERSSLDPSVFIVTYTAEHSHPHPTRKKSLSGSIRKESFATTSVTPDSADEKATKSHFSVELVPSLIAETTPVMEDVLVDKQSLKKEGSRVMSDGKNFNFVHETDAFVDDGWFHSIEELNGLAQQLLSEDDYFMYQIYDSPKS